MGKSMVTCKQYDKHVSNRMSTSDLTRVQVELHVCTFTIKALSVLGVSCAL